MPAIARIRESGLALAPGITALVGENGAGKSTVVEAIAGAWSRLLVGAVTHWGPAGAVEDADLARQLELDGEWPRPTGGCFLRAEAMHQHFSTVDRDGLELHGESFLAFVESRLTERGLWILDEPEAALSFRSCLRLLALFDALREHGSQVIVASLCCRRCPECTSWSWTSPGSTNARGLSSTWRDFRTAPERWLRHLVGEPDDVGDHAS